MTAALWRPARGEAWPVLGVQSYGQRCADIVVEMHTGEPQLIESAPLQQIHVIPMRPGPSWLPRRARFARAVVRARTARLIDHPCDRGMTAAGVADPAGESGSASNVRK